MAGAPMRAGRPLLFSPGCTLQQQMSAPELVTAAVGALVAARAASFSTGRRGTAVIETRAPIIAEPASLPPRPSRRPLPAAAPRTPSVDHSPPPPRATQLEIVKDDAGEYRVSDGDTSCTWERVREAWATDPAFVQRFCDHIVTECDRNGIKNGVFWECRGALPETVYGHVLIDAEKQLDFDTLDLASDLEAALRGAPGVLVLDSLSTRAGKNVWPRIDDGPRRPWTHLLAFLRASDRDDRAALFAAVAATAKAFPPNEKVYISTHGTDVPWLHVRINDTPKYYHHLPYVEEGRSAGGARRARRGPKPRLFLYT